MTDTRVSVVVPSFRRSEQLVRCLDGIQAQTRPPSEIIVARRIDDDETACALAIRGDVTEVSVRDRGTVAAMIAGVRASSGDIVAFTDDDAIPRPDWLERIVARFNEPSVGAVGGRDLVHDGVERTGVANRVGEITSVGKLIGNHHLGAPTPRDVSVLKGVNMAFRREALALPSGLRGDQDQPHFEVFTSLWAKRAGWRLVYDPAIVVDHYPGPRFDEHRRDAPGRSAVRDNAYNLVTSVLAGRPGLTLRRSLYGLLVGDRLTPGLARTGGALLRGERDVVSRLAPSLTGQSQALVDHLRRRVPSPITFGGRRSQCARPTIVLVAHDVHDHGGMERTFAELIRRGHGARRFIVVSGTLADELRDLVEWRRVPLPRRPFALKFSWFFFVAGARLLRIHADLVHTMGAVVPNRADLASVHFCHAAFVERARALPHSDASPLRRLNSRVARTLSLGAERWCYRPSRLRAAAAVSHGVKSELGRHYPGLPVSLTPNGVDTDRFAPDTEVRREVRGGERVGGDEVVALFVGGDWQRKGLPIAIEGLAIAVEHGAGELRLWVVGRGDEAATRGVAERLGVAERVSFFGVREDTERFYQAADLFVLPSLYEASPLAVHEAAASGLPIVATAASAAADLLGVDGCILVERDARSVGEAMADLAADPELRVELGARARSRMTPLSWDASVSSVLDVYGSLLSPELTGAQAG